MSAESILLIVGVAFAVIGFVFFIVRKLPKRIKRAHFTHKWRELQKLCVEKETWPGAVMDADDLLDEAMRRRRKSSKNMGERLVENQNVFSNNDAIWQAHKLADSLRSSENQPKLKEREVKESLVAFRQALRDLGAL